MNNLEEEDLQKVLRKIRNKVGQVLDIDPLAVKIHRVDVTYLEFVYSTKRKKYTGILTPMGVPKLVNGKIAHR